MKSFLLSIVPTIIIVVFIMSVFDQKVPAIINRLPGQFFILFILLSVAVYLLAAYWGIKGISKGNFFFNIAGLFISIAGIAAFAMAYQMSAGKGAASPGQFDHAFSDIEPAQQQALTALAAQTATPLQDISMVAYWKMHKNPANFSVCIQKGNIIALQVKNKPLKDLQTLSAFGHLNWLVLDNCNITSLSTLNLPLLQRLDVGNNQLNNLDGIQHSPQIEWLNFAGNPVSDSSALKELPHKDLVVSGN